jgi:predicted RNase H-like nuclease (RuvC/YqgF family)
MKATDLFEKFWETHDKKKFLRADLKKKLEDVGIIYFKTNGNFCYKYSYNQLKEIANKFHWLDEFDNETIDAINDKPVETNHFNNLNNEYNKLKELLAEKENEIEFLKSKLEAIPTIPKKKIIKKANNTPVIEVINEIPIKIHDAPKNLNVL